MIIDLNTRSFCTIQDIPMRTKFDEHFKREFSFHEPIANAVSFVSHSFVFAFSPDVGYSERGKSLNT